MKTNALRRLGSKSKSWVVETWVHWRHRYGYTKPVEWADALLNEEVDWWEKALAEPEKNWLPTEFRERTNLELPLQDELRELISAPPNGTVRILDVGSGPLTRIGSRWPGHEVQITATDPLANQYNALLNRLQIPHRVPVTFAHAEKLLEVFPPNFFDLAYASNSLDHGYDPLKAIEQMLAVTKPGSYVYLWHFSNEGRHECYKGMHQWNFDTKRGDFVIGNGKITHALTSHFGPAIRLSCEHTRAFNSDVVIARIKKVGL